MQEFVNDKIMNVLVGCEYSGIVRDAFEDVGWNAYSCDIIPTESEQTKAAGKHIQADILRVIEHITEIGYAIPFIDDVGNEFYFTKFDLFIAFPPCTYLSYAYTGERRFKAERLLKTADAIKFFVELWCFPVDCICLENPVGAIQHILPYTQIIHPYYFGRETGEDYTKRTCLWLKNLPKLTYCKNQNDGLFEKSKYVAPARNFYNANNGKSKKPVVHKAFCSDLERSKFHKGIATAMAEQWTEYLTNEYKQLKTNDL